MLILIGVDQFWFWFREGYCVANNINENDENSLSNFFRQIAGKNSNVRDIQESKTKFSWMNTNGRTQEVSKTV